MPVLSSLKNDAVTDGEVEKELNGIVCFSGDDYRTVCHQKQHVTDQLIETSFNG